MTRMSSVYPARQLLRVLQRCLCLGLLAGSSGCLFPVIDLEDESAPHALAIRARPGSGYTYLSPRAGTSERATSTSAGLVALSPRQHPASPTRVPMPKVQRLPRSSVLSPDIPAPELPTPATASACHQALHDQGVRFLALDPQSAPGVRWPIRLRGPVAGVRFEPRDSSDVFSVLDCRLALALYVWAGDLRSAGVRSVRYYSIYRPNARIAGSRRVSGHAHGLAIDAAEFTLRGGQTINVLDDWEGRARGEAPCPLRAEEATSGRILRAVTCSAADRNLFQIVLTPHYNKAHENHVHLEIKPDVDWTYVR